MKNKHWCYQISKIVFSKIYFGILKINKFLMNIWLDNWRSVFDVVKGLHYSNNSNSTSFFGPIVERKKIINSQEIWSRCQNNVENAAWHFSFPFEEKIVQESEKSQIGKKAVAIIILEKIEIKRREDFRVQTENSFLHFPGIFYIGLHPFSSYFNPLNVQTIF